MTVSLCRFYIAINVSYWLNWLSLILRTEITSYMNVKFSRELSKTNLQFQYVFNESVSKVKEVYQNAQLEELARVRAERLKKFYIEYAD